MITKQVIFEGRVQGVGFRYTVKDIARGFDVCGWVRNLPDGNVELQVSGEASEVAAFIREIVVESALARNITSFHANDLPSATLTSGFRIVT